MRRSHANGLLMVAALLWGAGNVAQKTVLNDIGPFTAVGLRCLIAALVLAPFFIRTTAKAEAVHLSRMAPCALMVTASFAVAVTLYQVAAGLSTVTNTGFLVNTSTVITPLAAWLLFRQPARVCVWPAAALTLLGIYCMSGQGFTRLNLGDALALGSAACYAVWMIYLGRFVTQYGHAGSITLLQFSATGICCLVIGLCFEAISLQALLNVMPELLLLGIVSTALAYLLQAIAQGFTSASEAAVIVSGEAIVGACFAFILLGEALDALGLAGAGLILCGIAVVQWTYPVPKPAQVQTGKPS